MSFDPEKVERYIANGFGPDGPGTHVWVEASEYDALLELYRDMKPAVVTGDSGVVEGIFTSYEAALAWAKKHRMDERNVRGGVTFHDRQFPL